MKNFEVIYEILILNLLQFFHLLFFIGADEILDNNNFTKRRLSNNHNDEIIKFKFVDFPKVLLRRFVFDSHIFIQSNPDINGFEKDDFFKTSFYLN